MNPDGTNFAEQYRAALVDFLLGNGGEAALLRAYDWGREALASGMTILEANAIHHEAMHSSVLGPLLKEPAPDLATRGQEFLWQSLAPFEMARRGFIEANATLRELNETLNQRVAERTESLRASEERYRELFENANDIIYTLDLGGNFTSLNKAGETVSGYSREEASQMNIGQMLAPEYVTPVRQGLERLIAGEPPEVMELEIVAKNGRRVPLEVSPRLICQDGKPVGAHGVARDITERQQAAEALRAASFYSRNLIETSLDPLVTISAEGKITDVNTATEKITGLSRERLIGTDFSDYFTDPEKARAGYQQMFREGTVFDYALDLRHRDGHITSVLYNASVYRDEAGQVTGVFAAARDITERQRAEKALRENVEELARSNAELEQFAYIASHDLQEPLRTTGSFAQLLQKRYEGKLDQTADEFIGYIVDGTQHMQRLISDLLTFGRVGTQGKVFEPADCAAVLAQAVAHLQIAIEEGGAVVTHDPLPVLDADPDQLGQLLQNLIGNSIKFHAAIAPRIHVAARQTPEGWTLSVQDNGIGIDPQFADRIFEVFQRLHTRAEYPGTGIGLAICKKIVQRHGGRIWVESAPGKGATFCFTIPS